MSGAVPRQKLRSHTSGAATQRESLVVQGGLRIVNSRWFDDPELRALQRAAAVKELKRMGVPGELLRGFQRWDRLVAVVAGFLEGKSARQIERETGVTARCVARLARVLELGIGLLCGCGRRFNHNGHCWRRRDWNRKAGGGFVPLRICRRGHRLVEKRNIYWWRGRRQCRVCRWLRTRRVSEERLRKENERAVEILKAAGINPSIGGLLEGFVHPSRMALIVADFRFGSTCRWIAMRRHHSIGLTMVVAMLLSKIGWRCGCGRKLAHHAVCAFLRGRKAQYANR